ncbi:MAG: MoxR family ATPase [Acidobacteriota bacterium]|jgi:MoxR-like ATPase
MTRNPESSRPLSEADVEAVLGHLSRLRDEIGKVIVGQRETVDHLLIALLAGGHSLLEGVPGLAKTLMIRTLADAVHLSFKRIQFTPDLMPSDITGTEVLEEDHGTGRRVFRFNRGPIFANLVLADEINRSPPKTQSALLEAMQEYEVTYGGETHPLARPFFVLATQNPIEQTGTYPLPEAQLDRFLLQLQIDYPSQEEEIRILEATTGSREASPEPVMTAEEILGAQDLVRQVHIGAGLLDHVARLVRSTRPAGTAIGMVRDYVEWGAGPRAGQSLILAGKARALLAGRFAVVLEDLANLAFPVLRHRILINFRGQAERVTPEQVTQHLLESVEPPASPLR